MITKKNAIINALESSKQGLREERAENLIKPLGMNKVNEILAIILIFVLTSLICTKLDHKIDIPWSHVMIPLYFLIVMFFGPMISYVILTWYSQKDWDEELEPERDCRPMFLGVLSFFWLDIKKPKNFLKLFLWVSMWVIGLVLLCLKIAGVGIHAAIVSVPFHIILLVLGYFIVIERDFFEDDFCFERLLASLMLTTISVFMILLAIQLETDVFWSWHIVLTPLYIFDGIIFGYVVFPFFACFTNIGPDHFLRDDPESGLAIWGAVTFFLMAPFLIFKILLGLTMDGVRDYTFGGIFAPIFVLESFGTIFYFMMWIAY